MLRPVFDFNAKSAVEAYLETLPPKVRDAIKNHQVLVGMNREMVIASKGRPPKKIREKDGETEYEEWIYGDRRRDVDFVRLVGDEVVRLEIMKVDGEKEVRTEKEVELDQPTVAKSATEPEVRPPNAPTLRRPGEDADPNSPAASGRPPARCPRRRILAPARAARVRRIRSCRTEVRRSLASPPKCVTLSLRSI